MNRSMWGPCVWLWFIEFLLWLIGLLLFHSTLSIITLQGPALGCTYPHPHQAHMTCFSPFVITTLPTPTPSPHPWTSLLAIVNLWLVQNINCVRHEDVKSIVTEPPSRQNPWKITPLDIQMTELVSNTRTLESFAQFLTDLLIYYYVPLKP